MRKFLLLAATVFPICALPATGPAEVIFTGSPTDGFIGLYARLFTDTSSITEVNAALDPANYAPCSSEVPNLGISRNTFWIRFDVRNRSAGPDVLLSIPYAEIDELDIFLIDGTAVTCIGHTGQSRPAAGRMHSDPEFVFPLDIPVDGKRQILLRVKGTKQIHVPMLLRSGSAFSASRATRNLLFGAFVGIMLVLALYNLFVFLSIKDTSYFFYVLYILAICGAQVSVNGIGQAYIWQDNVWWSSHASIILVLSSIVFGIEFARRFVNMKSVTPRLQRVAPFFHVLVAVDIIVYLFLDPWSGYKMAQAISGLSAIYLVVVMIVAIRKGSRQAGFFLLAWAAFLSGVVLFVLKDAGAIAYTGISVHAMTVGSAIEGVLLSFGLADRINILRREKERSQAQALAASLENERIIRDQNVMLELKVKERTHELVEANDELKRTQVQLVEAEKMAGLGQLTAGIAHEINNPINFINSNIPPLRRNLQDMVEVLRGFRGVDAADGPEVLKAVNDKCEQLGLDDSIAELDGMIGSIDEGARRTAEIVKGLRNFSRLDEDALKPADVNEGIRSTLALLSPQVRGHLVINTVLADLPQAECLPGKLNQAVMNLLTNAAQAVKARHGENGEGVVSIRTFHEAGRITIAVHDNGVGMTDEVKARIFEPFFTTKGVGEGTGLGLSITYSIVQKHNGIIAVESTPGQGSEFRITFPVRHQEDNIAIRA
jgi:two-component system, NtrC family, sensor kinase